MSNYALVTYSLKIRRRRSSDLLIPNNVINGDGEVLSNVLRESLQGLLTTKFSLKSRRLLLSSNNGSADIIEDDRCVSGMLRYGFYGDISDIENDKDVIVFKKDGTHTEYVDMFAGLYIKSESQLPYLVLSTYGKAGIKTVLLAYLQKTVFAKFPDFVFQLLPFWPAGLRDAYLKSDVNAVTITSYKKFKDSSDYKFVDSEETYEVVTQIRKIKETKKGGYQRTSMSIDEKMRKNAEDFTSSDEVQNVELSVMFNGRQRTLSVSKTGGHAPALPARFESVNDMVGGIPTHRAFKRESDQLITEWNI